MLNIKKNLDFVKEYFIIYIKSLKEYKINVFFSILMSLVYTILFSLFIYVMYFNFEKILNWNFNEYFFFIFIIGFSATFYGTFFFSMRLNLFIKNGSLNIFLTKPINIYLQYFLASSSFIFIINSFFYLVILIFFLIYNNLIFFNKIFYLILFNLLSGIFFILIHRVIDSVCLFLLNNFFIFNLYREFYIIFDRFPAHFFKNKIQFLSFFCANAYYGSYSTQFFFNKISNLFFLKLNFYLIFLNIICLFLIYFLWKIGLKKYSAFG